MEGGGAIDFHACVTATSTPCLCALLASRSRPRTTAYSFGIRRRARLTPERLKGECTGASSSSTPPAR